MPKIPKKEIHFAHECDDPKCPLTPDVIRHSNAITTKILDIFKEYHYKHAKELKVIEDNSKQSAAFIQTIPLVCARLFQIKHLLNESSGTNETVLKATILKVLKYMEEDYTSMFQEGLSMLLKKRFKSLG